MADPDYGGGMVDPSSVGWGMIAGAGQVYKNRHGILAAYDWIARYFGKTTRIAVTGPAGVGKSVLCEALTKRVDALEYTLPGQSEQVERRKRRVQNKRLEFIVLPGQDAGPRMKEEDVLLDKPVEGIVYAACFGFTTLREEAAKRKLVTTGQDTVTAFRDAQRRVDLEHLDHTLEHVRRMFSRHSKPCWMVVAVTKFDLFTNENQAAEEYYSPHGKSPFVDRMNKLHERLGTDRFRWSAMPVCAHPEDFVWNGNKISSEFSLEDRANSLKRFFTRVEQHCE